MSYILFLEVVLRGGDPCTCGDYIDIYDSIADLGEIRVYLRADFQSGSRVLKKVF